jgi:flagellar protein FlaG
MALQPQQRPRGRAPAPPADAGTDAETVRRAVAESNRRLEQKASELTFEFDDAAGRVVVRLIDRNTREVLRQIPSEQVLAIARALQQQGGSGALLRTDA